MKTLYSLLCCLLVSTQTLAWVSTQPSEQEFKFKFTLQKEKYEYTTSANTYEQAYERAAQACFNHFKAGRRVSEDQGLDIIDVCANPRSI